MRKPIIALGACALLLSAPAAADTATDWPGRTGRYVFEITRDGDPIGTQTIEIRQSGETVTATTESKVEVEMLGITVYRMNQVLEETFQGDRLAALKAETRNPQGLRKGEIRRAGDHWTGQLAKDRRDFECDCKTSTMWHVSSLEGLKIIEAAEAEPRFIKVEEKGTKVLDLPEGRVEARHFVVTGDIEREVWYDPTGIMVASEQIGSDGSLIRLNLIADPSGRRAAGAEAAE